MFVWGHAQPLKLCFPNDAVYEQSGMNLPERVTGSGLLPPLTELSSGDFDIKEACGDELPSRFLSFMLSNKGLIVKRVTWSHTSLMHSPSACDSSKQCDLKQSTPCLGASVITVC